MALSLLKSMEPPYTAAVYTYLSTSDLIMINGGAGLSLYTSFVSFICNCSPGLNAQDWLAQVVLAGCMIQNGNLYVHLSYASFLGGKHICVLMYSA